MTLAEKLLHSLQTATKEVNVSRSTKERTVRVPKWVPAGHPCQWSNDQLSEYEDKMEPTPMDIWRAIDDQVYSRPCDNPDCEMKAWSESVVEGEVVEEEPVTTSYEVEVKAGAEFDPTKYLPPGHPDDWSEEDWDKFDVATKTLPEDQAAALDQAAWMAMGSETRKADLPDAQPDEVHVSTEVDLNKDVWDMTEEEYEQFQAVLLGNLGGPKSIGSKGTTKSTTSNTDTKSTTPPAKGAFCKESCNGPGSKEEKYPTHLPGCPMHPDYTPEKWITPGSTSTYGGYTSCKTKHDRSTVFHLDGGLDIYASAYRDIKYRMDERVNIGVYMYDSWGVGSLVSPGLDAPWAPEVLTQQVLLEWPDFGTPDLEYTPLVDIVKWMLDQLAAGKTLETGCMGGHGRTGTMLACLLVAQGIPPGTALERVRKDHCTKAVENEKQGQFVAQFYKLYHGNENWRKDKAEAKLFKQQVKAGHKQSSSTWGKTSPGFKSGDGQAPRYDPLHKVWTSYCWRSGFTWDNEVKAYVNPNYSPSKGGDNK
jgi:hypothetical protein